MKSQRIPSGKYALKPHYVTPSEVDIAPHPAYLQRRPPPHRGIVIDGPTPRPPDDNSKTELDGFYLLEASGLAFPEDLSQCIISNKNLRTVVEDDLVFFTELLYVDVSENFLPFLPLGSFPKLIELRMACNDLSNIENVYGFDNLLYLDLAYNKLTRSSVQNLDVIPNLKELDLSGNNLRELPSMMSSFLVLEKLVLEYNKIEDNDIFNVLGSMPNLRYVDLANNFLSIIPPESCTNENLR
jgi:Leucine-rich repeat (LRR) protein